MKEFIRKMLELGAELDRAVSQIEINMIINDAEILYEKHIDHQSKVNNGVLDDVNQQSELLKDFQDFVNTCQTFEMIEDEWIENFKEQRL